MAKKKLKFNQIKKVILFGGSPLLLEACRWLTKNKYELIVYTSDRHVAEPIGTKGKNLGQLLKEIKVEYRVCEDINTESSLNNEITNQALGLGIGEAWSFSEDVIQRFGGRLVDFMGIPHPTYRGGAHYTWALLQEEKRWGANIQIINKDMVQGEFDSGEIVKSKIYPLPKNIETPQDFFDAAVNIEIKFIQEFLSEIKKGKAFDLKAPDESKSLFWPRLNTIQNGWINWSWDAKDIKKFIQAFDDPYAGASTMVDDKIVHLKGATVSKAAFHPFQSGLITRIHKNRVYVAAPSGLLSIKNVLDANGQSIVSRLKIGQRLFTPQAQFEKALSFKPQYSASKTTKVQKKGISIDTVLKGEKVALRLATLDDCNEHYEAWLADGKVNQFLETRWSPQSIQSIREFVGSMLESDNNYLFAIVEKESGRHVGNLKVGPVNRYHSYGDISYFIGEKSAWGKGYATDAIKIATEFASKKLGLHRIQAGLYESNIGSARALEKAGYVYEGRLKKQLKSEKGWEDHLMYAWTNDERRN